MILAKAPLRVSFFGGSSDLPSHYMKYTGATLSMAINKYVYVAVMSTPHNHIKVSYSQQEIVNNVDDLKNEIVRETLKHFNITNNIEITSFADIPTVGSGLGGSSAFTCALITSLCEFKGFKWSPYDIAELACKIEIDMCGWNVGKQDQYASAFGGMNYITYGNKIHDRIEGIATVTRVDNPVKIETSCILVPVGETRNSYDVISGINVEGRTVSIMSLANIATSAFKVVPNYNSYLPYMRESWIIKKNLSNGITSQAIDEIIDRAEKVTTCACKVLGAGGGGYVLIMADNISAIKKEFSDRVCLTFEESYRGAEVVYRD